MAEPNYRGPGLYRHYKGDEYRVLGRGLSEETVRKPGQPEHDDAGPEEVRVIYEPLSPGSLLEKRDEDFWTREFSVFNEQVRVRRGLDWVWVPRFEKIEPDDLVIRVCECGVVCEAFRATARCGRNGRHNMSYECPVEYQRVVAAEELTLDELRARGESRFS